MAYTTTARQFFEEVLSGALVDTSPLRTVGGVVEFEIQGDDGGSWYVDLDQGSISSTSTRPNIIVRARARDFMALVEGRMSAESGLMTGRLQLAGGVAHTARLMDALKSLQRIYA